MNLDFEIEDEWFLRKHYANLTPEFCTWWVGFYGTPKDYIEHDDEDGGDHEYYVRMAFALMGWNARGGA